MTSRFSHLLAKSWPPGGERARPPAEITLPGHLSSVLAAGRAILDVTASDQLAALGLDVAVWRDRLIRLTLLAAALHDVGKANDHFQRMILTGERQGIRHEWAGVWMLHQTGWREALLEYLKSPEDLEILWWTIAGHHPAYGRPIPPVPVDGTGSEIVALLSHPDVEACRKAIQDQFQLSLPAAANDVALGLTSGGELFFQIRQWLRQSARTWRGFSGDLRRFTAVCKACLIGCDVAGSALPRRIAADGQDGLIHQFLTARPSHDELREIISARLDGRPPRTFQQRAADAATRVTFLRAGCGTGKTLAAYLWAANQCPNRKLFVCYPTTGTATEGYRDYLFDADAHAGRAGARLFHGRADVDLEMILGVPADDPDSASEPWLRIDALDTWSTPIASCTADTVLGLVQNSRRGLYAWPALCGAAFVFDEVHAYDHLLFGSLLRFLREVCGVPVLLMTASLPTSRLEAIQDCLKQVGQAMEIVDGPSELERLPRYRRQPGLDSADPLREVAEAVKGGARVLWVCNTVNRAIAFADQAEARGLSPMVYHSRFRYEDRVQRHREVIDAFRANHAALAICTQVAEVSLDLSADLLVTDLAPVPALIQRLGRLNRRAVPPMPGQPAPPTKPFIVVEPDTALPYQTAGDPNPFATARQWLAKLGEGDLSQADMAAAWESLDEGLPAGVVPSAWLDGGPETTVRELREGTPGITVLLESDAEAVRRGELPLARAALPMPPPPARSNWQAWPQVRGCPVAPADLIEYDRKRGATWRKR